MDHYCGLTMGWLEFWPQILRMSKLSRRCVGCKEASLARHRAWSSKVSNTKDSINIFLGLVSWRRTKNPGDSVAVPNKRPTV